jgi:thiol-disulfide isomerase/thioredoxin
MKINIFCIVLFTLFGCSGGKEKSNSTDIVKIKLKEMNDQSIDLEEYKGKAVFINFWATWCGPCIQEMPTIENAQKMLTDQDVVFLLASNEDKDQIEGFIKRHTYNFHYVHLENLEELKIQALPTTFIFNPEGKLKFSETGVRNWNDTANIALITKIINDHEK